MESDTIRSIRQVIHNRFGLPFEVEPGENSEGQFIDFIPDDVPHTTGFRVRTVLLWRGIKCEFVPGDYSANLLNEMGKSSSDKKETFEQIVEKLRSEKGEFQVSINGHKQEITNIEEWPREWEQLDFKCTFRPIHINHDNDEDIQRVITKYTGLFMSLLMSLLPIEEIERGELVVGKAEGKKKTEEVTRYERNPVNRAMCLSIKGDTCEACGFNFQEVYGDLGDGFIHVHHKIPVSEMPENYQVDPVNDLVPVCPNCHAMLHQETPPISINELENILSN